MAIGQDKLAVTPLQMAMVAGTVANGGVLVAPRITDRVVDVDGRVRDDVKTTEVDRVMKPSTARQLTEMMANVVREGTGTAAALSGIAVAGKTGTAEKNPAINLNQVWFIGFAPVEQPDDRHRGHDREQRRRPGRYRCRPGRQAGPGGPAVRAARGRRRS